VHPLSPDRELTSRKLSCPARINQPRSLRIATRVLPVIRVKEYPGEQDVCRSTDDHGRCSVEMVLCTGGSSPMPIPTYRERSSSLARSSGRTRSQPGMSRPCITAVVAVVAATSSSNRPGSRWTSTPPWSLGAEAVVAGSHLIRGHRQPGQGRRCSGADHLPEQQGHGVSGVVSFRQGAVPTMRRAERSRASVET
jgi:hypothetical protein